MDPASVLPLSPAPRLLFERLPQRAQRPRFMLPEAGGWRPVSHEAYADMIRDVASFLAAEGLARGQHAAIFAPNRVEWMAAALAIQAAGGVMVPIYASSTAEQAAYIAEHSEASFLFVDTEELLARVLERWPRYHRAARVVCLDDRLDPAGVARDLSARGLPAPSFAEIERRVLSWSRVRALGQEEERRRPGGFAARLDQVALADRAIMLYTSGTTGHPKGVPLTHANLTLNTADWIHALAPALERDQVDLLWLPMSHIFGYGELTIGDALGFTSYLSSPKQVLEHMPAVRPQVFMSVPSYWEKLALAAAGSDPAARRAALLRATGGRLSFCLSGGAGLKREVKELLHECGLLVIEGYGLTETSPTLTLNRPGAFRFDSVGRPLDSVELRLAEDGEILAKGPSVFAGYFKDEDATRAAFTADGWFKTGDVGRFTADGFLAIVDRKKDILVTAGGKNVPPANIELRFKDDPLIQHVVVYGDGKHYLVAGIWPNQEAVAAALGGAISPGQVQELLSARVARVNDELPSWERIKRFVVLERPLTVEGGFLTPTLKLRRKKVYEAFQAELEGVYA